MDLQTANALYNQAVRLRTRIAKLPGDHFTLWCRANDRVDRRWTVLKRLQLRRIVH